MKARDRSRLNRFLGGSETVLNKGVLKGSPPRMGDVYMTLFVAFLICVGATVFLAHGFDTYLA